jgi:hypothetical protein
MISCWKFGSAQLVAADSVADGAAAGAGAGAGTGVTAGEVEGAGVGAGVGFGMSRPPPPQAVSTSVNDKTDKWVIRFNWGSCSRKRKPPAPIPATDKAFVINKKTLRCSALYHPFFAGCGDRHYLLLISSHTEISSKIR